VGKPIDEAIMDRKRFTFDVESEVKKIKASELGPCLDRAKQIICGDRQDAYGNPEDSFARIANYWSVYLSHHVSPLDVAHLMTLLKVARMQGQKSKRDNYDDACGYLSIAAGRLLGESE